MHLKVMNLTCCYVILLFYFCRKFLHIHYYLYLQLFNKEEVETADQLATVLNKEKNGQTVVFSSLYDLNDESIKNLTASLNENSDYLNDNVKKLVDNNNTVVSVVAVHRLDNITDEERKNKDNYLSIMKNNLE